jgi:hypothetical protein
MTRVISAVVSSIKTVVDDNNRAVVITQWTPADMIIPRVPVNPRWSPITGRNPIPSQTDSPMPSAIMRNTPAPRFIGDPCPSGNRVPNPSSMIIGPPGIMVDLRYPDISIGAFIHPTSVVGQLGLIRIQLHREIGSSHMPVVKNISSSIPLHKAVLESGIDIIRPKNETPIGSYQFFS